MKYVDTRGIDSRKLTACDVVLEGTTESGGLWVPEKIPTFNKVLKEELTDASFEEVVLVILRSFDFVGDSEEQINEKDVIFLIKNAYKDFWHGDRIELMPINGAKDYFLNLHFGPTGAFKDYALALVGQIAGHLLKKRGLKGISPGATSGDTGPAAMANVANENLSVNILYPYGGTSIGQEQQMLHFSGENTQAYAMEDSLFDDCQDLVKAVFNDQEFIKIMEKSGKKLISINSINWLRIVGQVAYITYAMLKFEGSGIKPNLVIPSGNSGHWLAAWITKQMGINIGTITLATNDNDILAEVVKTGKYFPKEAVSTIAPAMDISKSSNFERALYFLYGSKRTANLMIDQAGHFILGPRELKKLQDEVSAFSASGDEIENAIMNAFSDSDVDCIIDPHTATGFSLDEKGLLTDSSNVYFSTAHPMKFMESIISIISSVKSGAYEDYKTKILGSLPTNISNVLSMNEEEMKKRRKVVKFSLDDFKEILLTC